MRRLRRLALLASLASLPLGTVSFVTEARASVSIAVAFDALVKDSASVAVFTPVEQKSVWEEGRIYTYTRVRADQAIAGEHAAGDEAWVRTMGGVVGHIGQHVDGEAVLTVGRPSVLFLRQATAGLYVVVARAQGQFPLTIDDSKVQRIVKSGVMGVLLPPKTAAEATMESQIGPPSLEQMAQKQAAGDRAQMAIAHEVLHMKKLDDGAREIAAAWKRLHASK